jgi:hypothetical protein
MIVCSSLRLALRKVLVLAQGGRARMIAYPCSDSVEDFAGFAMKTCNAHLSRLLVVG